MYTAGQPTGTIKNYLDWILQPEAQRIVRDLGCAHFGVTDGTAISPDPTPQLSAAPGSDGAGRFAETLISRAIQVTGISTVVLVLLIFVFLIREGLPAFVQVPLADLLSARWYY